VVRVVTVDPNYSVELCGGTHAGSTGELGFCMITAESGVAAGVRRIEAVCGRSAELQHLQEQSIIKQVSEQLKNPRDIVKAVAGQGEELTAIRKQMDQLEGQLIGFIKEDLLKKTKPGSMGLFIGEVVEAGSIDMLKKIAHEIRISGDNLLIALAAKIGGKVAFAIGISDQLTTTLSLDATVLIKTKVAGHIKGGGGGQKGLATAGGQDINGIEAAIESVRLAMI
jgi:alanyl-tRNA synthetase